MTRTITIDDDDDDEFQRIRKTLTNFLIIPESLSDEQHADLCRLESFLASAPTAPDSADEELRTREGRLQYLCAAMYQAAGAYDMPVRFLDILSAAGNGQDVSVADIEKLLPCDPPAQDVGEVGQDVDRLHDIITKSLSGYRVMHHQDEDGDAIPLVDMLTPIGDGDISRGLQELELLTDHVWSAIDSAMKEVG